MNETMITCEAVGCNETQNLFPRNMGNGRILCQYHLLSLMAPKRRTQLQISCPHCGDKMYCIVKGDIQDVYDLTCKGTCKKSFKYIPEKRNIQCHYCDNINKVTYDEREEFTCEKCNKPMSGYVTQNSGAILKEIRKTLNSFPQEYTTIKEHGLNFICDILDGSNNLGERQHLKNALSLFQNSVNYFAEHLKKHGKYATREQDTTEN